MLFRSRRMSAPSVSVRSDTVSPAIVLDLSNKRFGARDVTLSVCCTIILFLNVAGGVIQAVAKYAN